MIIYGCARVPIPPPGPSPAWLPNSPWPFPLPAQTPLLLHQLKPQRFPHFASPTPPATLLLPRTATSTLLAQFMFVAWSYDFKKLVKISPESQTRRLDNNERKTNASLLRSRRSVAYVTNLITCLITSLGPKLALDLAAQTWIPSPALQPLSPTNLPLQKSRVWVLNSWPPRTHTSRKIKSRRRYLIT